MATPPPTSSNTNSTPTVLAPADFADQFAACYERLWGLAAAMLGNRADAEDVVQEAALVALRRLDQFRPGTNFVAWMAKIVRLQAFNWSRKRTGRRTEPVDPADLDRTQAGGINLADPLPATPASVTRFDPNQTDFDDAVMAGLATLSVDARACLLLRVVHQLSYREISQLMEIAEGTAMSHVHRGKQALRDKLAADSKQLSSHESPRK